MTELSGKAKPLLEAGNHSFYEAEQGHELVAELLANRGTTSSNLGKMLGDVARSESRSRYKFDSREVLVAWIGYEFNRDSLQLSQLQLL